MTQQTLTPTAPPAAAAPPAPTTGGISVVRQSLTQLGPLINDKGELQLDSVGINDRLVAFEAFAESTKANLPLWEASLLSTVHPGTTMVPIPVRTTLDDAWHGDDAKTIKLKPNHVEPKADWLIKLAQMLGINLIKVFAGVTEDTGTKMYEVRYNAWMMLPNGCPISVEGIGKAQELYTGQGGKQAHIIESTEKKAKRNAIKALLGIPTSMPEEQFKRPWVLLRPVFTPGVSAETDKIVAAISETTERAKALLYGGKLAQLETGDDGPSFDALLAAVESIDSAEKAAEVAARIKVAKLTGDERAQLGARFKARKALIETGEVAPGKATVDAQAEGGY